MTASALLGLRTVVYYVPDLARARDWYAAALGIAPYFDTPYYVGFNVGGFELGLHPEEGGWKAGHGGTVAYWGVPDIASTWADLAARGAQPMSAPQEVGEGIQVATVADPFGNLLGIIENPHFPNTP